MQNDRIATTIVESAKRPKRPISGRRVKASQNVSNLIKATRTVKDLTALQGSKYYSWSGAATYSCCPTLRRNDNFFELWPSFASCKRTTIQEFRIRQEQLHPEAACMVSILYGDWTTKSTIMRPEAAKVLGKYHASSMKACMRAGRNAQGALIGRCGAREEECANVPTYNSQPGRLHLNYI